MYSHRRDVVEILLFYFYFGQQRFSQIPFIRNNRERPNVALQRLAHATYKRSLLPASPLQALVGMRSAGKAILIRQLNFAIPKIKDYPTSYLHRFARQLGRFETCTHGRFNRFRP